MRLDFRSLAAYRIAIAGCVIVDLIDRSRNLTLHYTDSGALPRTALINDIGDSWRFSLHLDNGTAVGVALWFLIAGACALGMMVGWRTRLMTFLTWVLTISLHNRNPLVLQGGDVFLRCILLFSCFLPLGAAVSVDRIFRRPGENETQEKAFSSPWTFLFALQVFIVYFFTGVLKLSEVSWQHGVGGYFTFNAYQFMTGVGVWISKSDLLMKIMNWVTPISEILLPFGLLIPYRFWKPRLATVVGFMGLHVAILIMFTVGMFPWICLSLWLAFLPSEFWDRIVKKWASSHPPSATIFYDGECSICSKIALAAARFMGLHDRSAVAAQSDAKASAILKRENSWVVQIDSKSHLRFDALIAVMGSRSGLKALAAILRSNWISTIGDQLYRVLAEHRPRWAKLVPEWGEDPRTSAVTTQPSLLARSVVYFLAIWLIAHNIGSLPGSDEAFRRYTHQPWAYAINLDQHWDMFSRPIMEDGWFILEGTLADGSKIDLLQGATPVDWSTPKVTSERYDGERTRKLLLNLYTKRREGLRKYFVGAHCIRWNDVEKNSIPLEAMELFYMKHLTAVYPGGKQPVEKVQLWRHECFAGALEKWKIDVSNNTR